MNNIKKEISSITFGIFSPQEILDRSVCKIDVPKKNDRGSVYDPLMGTTNSSETCMTCNENAIVCTGHIGHIELNEPIVHPLFYKRVVSFLNCFCLKCSRLLITKERVILLGINRFRGENRFNRIREKIKKNPICCNPECNSDQPAIKFSSIDNTFTMVYIDKNKTKTSIIIGTHEIRKIFDNILDEDVKLIGFDPDLVHPRNFIITILPVMPPCGRPYVKADGKLCDDDLTNQYIEIIKNNNNLLIDENKEYSEAKRQKYIGSLQFRILTIFNNSQGKAKHTTNSRPIKGIKERLTGKHGLIRGNIMGKRCEGTGRTVIGPEPTLKMGELAVPVEMSKILVIPERVTKFNITKLQNLIDNGKVDAIFKPDGKTKINIKRFRHGTRIVSGDIVMKGSKVYIKKNDVWKLCEPNFEPLVKKYIFHIGHGEPLVKTGTNNDKYIDIDTGKRVDITNNKQKVNKNDVIIRNEIVLKKTIPSNRIYKIDIGWIVERKIKDGDYVLLNRQPTLHKASMQAMKIVIRPYKTLRFNLAITKPFNADFDGDEMNIHVPQSLEAQAELKMLSSCKQNIISAQSSKPNVAIVQDNLLGCYRMTMGTETLTKSQFLNITNKIHCPPWEKETYDGLMSPKYILNRLLEIKEIFKRMGNNKNIYNGRSLFSIFLPKDLNYERKNNKHPDEPIVKIYKGVMYEGTLDKSIVGSSHNSLIKILHKEYNVDVASYFIDCIQFVTNDYLLVNGFSIGLGDCLLSNKKNKKGLSKREEIQDVIKKSYIEAEGIKTTTNYEHIREMRINGALNKAKDIGLRIAKDSLEKDNNFLSTVNAGSKGDFFNIAQITGLLGQQNLKGKRVPLFLNHGQRTLPHYPFGDLPPEVEYESRGFIASSFIEGLNPREFYFHAMSGREGISDTAMGTATSGYIQRRIVKLTEDIKVQYDGTVRDVSGRIYQFIYGEMGTDPTQTVKVHDKQQFCDVGRLIDKLNMKFETNG